MGKRRRIKTQEGATDDSRANFQTLFSCIQSPQVFLSFWLNPFVLYLFKHCLESMLEFLLLLLFKIFEFGVIKLRIVLVNAGKFPVIEFCLSWEMKGFIFFT